MTIAVVILVGVALIQLFVNLVLFFMLKMTYEELKDKQIRLLPIELKEGEEWETQKNG